MRFWRLRRNPSTARHAHRVYGLECLESRQLLSVSPVGNETLIGESTNQDLQYVHKDVAADAAGNFTVVWQRYGEQDFDIYARRYDSSGTPLGAEFQVNGNVAGEQSRPAVAVNDAGQLVIVWQSSLPNSTDTDIFAAFYDAGGTLLNGDVLVNSDTAGKQLNPDVAISNAGRVLVSWGPYTALQFFDAAGNAQGGEFGDTFQVFETRVAFDADGNYTVAGFEMGSVVWRRYTADDVPLSYVHKSHRLVGTDGMFGFDMNSTGELVVAAFANDRLLVQRIAASDTPLGLPLSVPVVGSRYFDLDLDDAGNIAVGTINFEWDDFNSWNSVHLFDADNTLNDVLTFGDNGNPQSQPAAVVLTGLGQGVAILNRKLTRYNNDANLVFQQFATDTLTISGVLAPGIEIVRDRMIVPIDLRELDVRLRRAASVEGGAAGIHSVLNLANWQLWRGNENVSSQITAVDYANGRVMISLAGPLPTGDYRLIASDMIQDTAGNALDGDEDGTPGGLAERRFSVGAVQPVGDQVTTFDQRAAVDIASNASGQFAAIWLRGGRLIAQFFDAAGHALTSELSLNSVDGTDLLLTPRASLDDTGNLHILWSRSSTGAGWWATFNASGILTRPLVALPNKTYNVAISNDGRAATVSPEGVTLFDSQGMSAGPIISGNANGVGFLRNGELVIGTILNEEISLVRFDASGHAIGAPILVQSGTLVLAKLEIAANPQGGFAVGWQSYVQDASNYKLIRRQANVQVFDANGLPTTQPIIVANEPPYTDLTQNPNRPPGIAFDGSGRFVVTWQNYGIDGEGLGVGARGYLPDGTPLGPAFRVNTPEVGHQSSPVVAANADGRLAIGWLGTRFSHVQFFQLFDLPTVDLNGGIPGVSFADTLTPTQFSQHLASNLTISDLGNSPLFGTRVHIRSFAAGDLILVDTSGSSLVATFENGGLTIAGEADRATYEHVLRTVGFQPASSRLTGDLIELDFSVDFGSITTAVSTAALTLYLPGSVSIVNRSLFYNNSFFDKSSQINSRDNLARATDKTAYLPGSGPSTFANISSYTRGINGLMIDLSANHGAISLDDFVFRVGSTTDPDNWAIVDTPAAFVLTVLNESTHRISFGWRDGAIKNTWLEVTMLANANTGLAANDVFYFGSRVGDTGLGNNPSMATTTSLDQLATRANVGPHADVSNPYDFDRSGGVTAADELASRANVGVLRMLNLPAPAVAVPLAATPLAVALAPADRFASSSAITSAIAQRGTLALPADSRVSLATAIEPVTAARSLNAVALAIALNDETAPPTGIGLDEASNAAETMDDDLLLDALLAS